MSKLGKNLFARPDRDLYAQPLPVMDSFSKHESWEPGMHPLYRQYRVGIRLETQVMVEDGLAKTSDIYHATVRDSKQKILEEVFGEFRQPLYELRQEAMKRGCYDMAKRVNDILDQMFKDNE